MIDLPTLFNWLFQNGRGFCLYHCLFHHLPHPQKGMALLRLYRGRGLAGVSRLHASEHWGGGGLFLCHSGPGLVLPRVRFLAQGPVTIFLITGIFPLVPGAGIYYTGYHLFMSDNSLALDKGLETIKDRHCHCPWALALCCRCPPFSSPAPAVPQNAGASPERSVLCPEWK